MKAELGRRVFLGSAVTLGIGSIGVINAAGALRAEPDGDVVYNEIVGQFMDAIGRMQGRPDAEAARRVGSSLRLLAAWGQAHRIDDAIRRGIDERVRQHGRQALLARPFDLRTELVMRGWRLPPGFAPLATPADFGDSLDDLRVHGITQHWSDYAAAFEQAAERLHGAPGRLTRVQGAPNECTGANFMLMMLESQVFLACTLGLAVGPEFCAVATALVLGWKWRMWAQGC